MEEHWKEDGQLRWTSSWTNCLPSPTGHIFFRKLATPGKLRVILSVCHLPLHFLHTCISAYFITVIAAYSVLKKFSTIPSVRSSFARRATRFRRFCATFVGKHMLANICWSCVRGFSPMLSCFQLHEFVFLSLICRNSVRWNSVPLPIGIIIMQS